MCTLALPFFGPQTTFSVLSPGQTCVLPIRTEIAHTLNIYSTEYSESNQMEWLQSALASVIGGEGQEHAHQSAEDTPDAHLQSSGMLSKVRCVHGAAVQRC